jgi:hypothetical protein
VIVVQGRSTHHQQGQAMTRVARVCRSWCGCPLTPQVPPARRTMRPLPCRSSSPRWSATSRWWRRMCSRLAAVCERVLAHHHRTADHPPVYPGRFRGHPSGMVRPRSDGAYPQPFAAYASGDRTTLDRFTWPDAQIRCLGSAVTFGAINNVYAPAGGARRPSNIAMPESIMVLFRRASREQSSGAFPRVRRLPGGIGGGDVGERGADWRGPG